MSTTFKFRVICEEFPGIAEEDSITFVSNFKQSLFAIAKELSESYMQNVIYDWDDDTEPSDLFEISVKQEWDGPQHVKRFGVSFFSNVTFSLDHKIVVELEECGGEPDEDSTLPNLSKHDL